MKNKFFDEIRDIFLDFIFNGQRVLWPCFILILLLKYFFPIIFLSILGTILSFLLMFDILYLWNYDYKEYQKIQNKVKLKNPWWLNPWHILYPFIFLIPCLLFLWGYSVKGLLISLLCHILNVFIVVYYDEENNDLLDSNKIT